MKLLAREKITASLLIVGGFVAWLFIKPIFGDRCMSCVIGCAEFFIVGYFLPETLPITFLSRRSSLGLVELFTLMTGNQILRDRPMDSTLIESPMIQSKLAWFAQQLIFKWLNRRSHRRSDTWTSFSAARERWKMPSPSIVEKP